jgi:hypothetical protein
MSDTTPMYLVVYSQQSTFVTSLHSTREAAEAVCEDLARRYDIDPEDGDEHGEELHIIEIVCDGGPAEDNIYDVAA